MAKIFVLGLVLIVAVLTILYSVLENESSYKTFARRKMSSELTSVGMDESIDRESWFSSTLSNNNLRRLAWREGKDPAPVWFLSFPESGVVAFLHLMQKSTGYSTATNYGNVLLTGEGTLVQSAQDSTTVYPNGPSYYSTLLVKNPRSVAVRTHATGYCLWCHPSQYMVNNFYASAASGYRMKDGKISMFQYNPGDVKKMIHLIRDPYDTVVARYFSYSNLVKHKLVQQARHTGTLRLNPTGFRAWCRRMDQKFGGAEMAYLSQEARKFAEGVPCRQEFIKIIRFHDKVLEMEEKYGIERLVVKYENYVEETDKTVWKVNEFMGYETKTKGFKTPFGDSGIWVFAHYYTDKERRRIAAFLRRIVSNRLWAHMRMYVPDIHLAELYGHPV